jgi:hypothetical protein
MKKHSKKIPAELPRNGAFVAAKTRRAGKMRAKQDRRAKDARNGWQRDHEV